MAFETIPFLTFESLFVVNGAVSYPFWFEITALIMKLVQTFYSIADISLRLMEPTESASPSICDVDTRKLAKVPRFTQGLNPTFPSLATMP